MVYWIRNQLCKWIKYTRFQDHQRAGEICDNSCSCGREVRSKKWSSKCSQLLRIVSSLQEFTAKKFLLPHTQYLLLKIANGGAPLNRNIFSSTAIFFMSGASQIFPSALTTSSSEKHPFNFKCSSSTKSHQQITGLFHTILHIWPYYSFLEVNKKNY